MRVAADGVSLAPQEDTVAGGGPAFLTGPELNARVAKCTLRPDGQLEVNDSDATASKDFREADAATLVRQETSESERFEHPEGWTAAITTLTCADLTVRRATLSRNKLESKPPDHSQPTPEYYHVVNGYFISAGTVALSL
eukprot:SAG31_NODE_571_length_13998_cov_4.346212_10_plen_140_part_00